jgi:selenocysteine lyase/cysteine desulfurase
MIYFDNAATTKYKSEGVINAFIDYVKDIGVSPTRGTYPLAIDASRLLYQARKAVCTYFGSVDSSNICFTKNSTEAINLFVRGYCKKGDNVLISPFEHNAVLRPIHKMMEEGIITYDILPEEVLYEKKSNISKYIKTNTRVVFLTLASNLTGQIVFSSELSREIHKTGVKVFVDSSQGAGKVNLDMYKDDVDFLAFTGHKDIMALPGVGGLVYKEKLIITPLIQGGTGIHGENFINPDAYPDAYEAGTLNMPAIAALKSAIDELTLQKKERVITENFLMQKLVAELNTIQKVLLYRLERERVSTVAFNIKGKTSDEVVEYLNGNEICVRGGIHCAILAHQTIGTVKNGAIRVSINYQNTEEEILQFIKVINEVAR